MAVNHGIDVAAGVVDSDFRGELKVVLVNSSDKTYKVQESDRIAQLIVERIADIPRVKR